MEKLSVEEIQEMKKGLDIHISECLNTFTKRTGLTFSDRILITEERANFYDEVESGKIIGLTFKTVVYNPFQ